MNPHAVNCNGLHQAKKGGHMKLYSPILQTAGVTVLLFLLPQALHAQDVCEAFAKYGIYDTQTATSDTDKASSFRSWFCQSKFESKQAADSAGLSLGYGEFTLGFDSNSESWAQFSSNYCRDDSYSAKYRQATLSFVQTINANASNNMLACFLRGGLHARIVPGVRQDTFYVQARMNPTGAITKASVVAFSVIGGTCSGPMENGYEITAAGVEQVCQRSSEQAVDISLSASEQVNWDTPRGLKKLVGPPTTSFQFDVYSGNQSDCVGLPGTGTSCRYITVSSIPSGKYISAVSPDYKLGPLFVGSPKSFTLRLAPHENAHSDLSAARDIHICGSSADDSNWRQAVIVEVSSKDK
jgi:hypothetical protein